MPGGRDDDAKTLEPSPLSRGANKAGDQRIRKIRRTGRRRGELLDHNQSSFLPRRAQAIRRRVGPRLTSGGSAGRRRSGTLRPSASCTRPTWRGGGQRHRRTAAGGTDRRAGALPFESRRDAEQARIAFYVPCYLHGCDFPDSTRGRGGGGGGAVVVLSVWRAVCYVTQHTPSLTHTHAHTDTRTRSGKYTHTNTPAPQRGTPFTARHV